MFGSVLQTKSEPRLAKPLPMVSVMGPNFPSMTTSNARPNILQSTIKLRTPSSKDKINLIKSRPSRSYQYLEALQKERKDERNWWLFREPSPRP